MTQRFDCQENVTNSIYKSYNEFNFKSVTLLSPCYPDDYNSCNKAKYCYIMLTELPNNTWIGVYLNEASSVSDPNDQFLINYKNSKWNQYTPSSIAPGLFYHIYEKHKQDFTCQLIQKSESSKLKIEIKCE